MTKVIMIGIEATGVQTKDLTVGIEETEALIKVIAIGAEEEDLVLTRKVQLQGVDLAQWTGILLLGVMGFSSSS